MGGVELFIDPQACLLCRKRINVSWLWSDRFNLISRLLLDRGLLGIAFVDRQDGVVYAASAESGQPRSACLVQGYVSPLLPPPTAHDSDVKVVKLQCTYIQKTT